MQETMNNKQVTEFSLLDATGTPIARGEFDGDIYRVFAEGFVGGYKEFEDIAEMFRECGGCAIQPEMFQTRARTRQLKMKLEENRKDTHPHV